MALPTYSTGTASVAVGGTVVTGVGGLWSGINVKQGDFISFSGLPAVLITAVIDTTHLQIPPWAGTAQTNVAYIIYQNYVGRVVGVAAAEDIGDMLERLRNQTPIYNVPAGDTEPDPSYGVDGEWAYQVETNTWWEKDAGVWVLLPGPPSGGVGGAAPPADGLVYGRKKVGAADATWTRAVAVAGDTMTGALSLAADPTAALHAATKQYVDASVVVPPSLVEAMAYSGMQLNGSFEVNQQALGGIASGHVCDNWAFSVSGSAVCVANIYAGSFGGGSGFSKHFGMTVTTAQPSMGAGEYVILFQRIEGYRVSRLGWGTAGALPLTIGFWSGHHRTGLYSVAFRGLSGGRSYVATYTQNVADTAEYKVITIPGDTTGTWLTDNGVGLDVCFTVACGTTYTTAAGAWTAGNFIAATGQTNGVAATSDAFRIMGVVVLPGTQTPTAAQSPLLMRPYGEELQTCLRYFESVPMNSSASDVALGQCLGSSSATVLYPYKVLKRAVPTFAFSAASHFTLQGVFGGINACTAVAATTLETGAARLTANVAGTPYTQGAATFFARNGTSAAYIWFDARL